MFDTLSFTLASAVADNGTVTASYPSGRTKGHYDWAAVNRHVLFVSGNKHESPADFTLTFNANASGITVTNKSGGAWASGSACRLQLARAGSDDRELKPADKDRVRMVENGLFLLDLGSPKTADADGVAASQTVAASGSVSIDGALASGGVATFDTPRNVVAAWTGTAIVTINGTDEYGATLQEKSSSGTSHTGAKAFKTVTSATVNASVTGLTMGTGEVLGLPVAIQKADQILAEYKNGVLLPRKPGKVYLPFEIEQTELLAPTNEELVSPVAGTFSRLRTNVQTTLGSSGTLTMEIDAVAVVGLAISHADAAAAGTRSTDTPTAGDASTVVEAGSRIAIVPSAGYATAGAVNGVVEIDVSTAGQLDGAIVVASASEPTATTGDVRGTYDPSFDSDDTSAIKLLVALPDPAEKGLTQFDG